MLALLLMFLMGLSGTLASYAFDRSAPFAARIAMGVVVGCVALGHIAFLLFCAMGLNVASLLLLFILAGACCVAMWRRYSVLLVEDWRVFKSSLLQRETWATRFFLLFLFGVLWAVFRRAMFERPDGIYTGYVNNYGDLPLHLQIIGTFAHEGNYPPQSPIYAGVRFSYPFMADFLSAIWLRLGLNLEYSMLMQNVTLMIAGVLLLRHLTWRWVRDRVAVALAPWLVILSGGLGWTMLWSEARQTTQGQERGLFGLVLQPFHDYTKYDEVNLQWGNAISTLFITQRAIILGVPILIFVVLLWWNSVSQKRTRAQQSGESEDRVLDVEENRTEISAEAEQRVLGLDDGLSNNRMLLSGLLVGALPWIHAHFFATLMACAFLLTLFFRAPWLRFWIPAIVLSVPQLLWLVGGDNKPVSAFGWQPGWVSQTNIVWFWWRNAGLFIPSLFAIWLWAWLRHKNRREGVLSFSHFEFFLPFFLIGFIVPNLWRLAPWDWDNTKVFFVWWIFSSPFVALFLAWLWSGVRWRPWRKIATVACFFALTFAGALDTWRGLSSNSAPGTPNGETRIYSREDMNVADFLNSLPSGGVFLHAPTFNTPASLAGKMSVMGYIGHLGSYGVDYGPREADMRNFFRGEAGSETVPQKYGARYIVVGTQERDFVRGQDSSRELAPPEFWKRWKEVGRIGEYSIFETQHVEK